MADLSEWAISTVSEAALEGTINSFDTALRAAFEVNAYFERFRKAYIEMVGRPS
jgi:hypothetical protein